MAVSSITYTDKVDLNTTAVADINKTKASDLNEIKSVVNNNSTILGDTSDLLNGLIKIKRYRSSITVASGSTTTSNMGTIPTISNYTFVGLLPEQTGYSDQWIVSFGNYSGHVQVMARNYYSGSLTAYVSCYAIYIKTSYYNSVLES